MNIVIVDDSIINDLSEMLKMISSELPFAIKIDSYADSFTFLDFILKNIHMIHDHIIQISKSLKPTFFNERLCEKISVNSKTVIKVIYWSD